MSYLRHVAGWIIVVLLQVSAPCPSKAQTFEYEASIATSADSTARPAKLGQVRAEENIPGLKSRKQALLLSLLGTIVPLGVSAFISDESKSSDDAAVALLFLGGGLVGPSLGHFYACRPGRALVGIGLRAVALVGLAGGFAAAWNNNTGGSELMLASLALGGTVLAWDIVKAPHSADVHNKRLGSRIAIALTPLRHATGARLSTRISF